VVKKYKSEAMAAIHETIEGLFEIGAVEKQTIRHFDDACLTAIQPLTPEEIRAIRERGVKKPGGPALCLLTVLQKKGVQAIS
jgi:putative transcriptional regulator